MRIQEGAKTKMREMNRNLDTFLQGLDSRVSHVTSEAHRRLASSHHPQLLVLAVYYAHYNVYCIWLITSSKTERACATADRLVCWIFLDYGSVMVIQCINFMYQCKPPTLLSRVYSSSCAILMTSFQMECCKVRHTPHQTMADPRIKTMKSPYLFIQDKFSYVY